MADVTNSKLLHIDTGILNIQDACIVLVKTEWNASIVDELERGCINELKKHGVATIISIMVPGAFEIPFTIRNHWEKNGTTTKKPSAYISLGCIVRGDTPHFDYVCRAVTDGVVQLNLTLPVPTIFGVLTVDNDQQAKERIGGKHGHKGEEAAITALKMISLTKS
ncbi:MAG: 6,7-dimethyl-8-ribityllumazine synthase [Chitinophagaceae bacterium]|nr:6,7-dimethyl-8-ribityllumazine synthase [Chitinophagaceae bacterium]